MKIMKKLLAIAVLLSFVVLFSSVIVINTMHTEHMGHGCQSGRDFSNTQESQASPCSVCAVLKQAEQLFKAVAVAFVFTAIIFFTISIAEYDLTKDFFVSLVGCKVTMNT